MPIRREAVPLVDAFDIPDTVPLVDAFDIPDADPKRGTLLWDDMMVMCIGNCMSGLRRLLETSQR